MECTVFQNGIVYCVHILENKVSGLYALCLTCLRTESPVEPLMGSSVAEYGEYDPEQYDNRQRNPSNGKNGKKGAKGKKGKQPFQLFPPYRGRPTY